VAATHRARRIEIDTGQEAVVYLHRNSPIVRSEGFSSQARVEVHAGERSILATLGVVGGGILALEEAGVSGLAPLGGEALRAAEASPTPRRSSP
jgi:thymidine phosphorylase